MENFPIVITYASTLLMNEVEKQIYNQELHAIKITSKLSLINCKYELERKDGPQWVGAKN